MANKSTSATTRSKTTKRAESDTITDLAEIPKERPMTGRGGKNNFGTSIKACIQTEEQRAVAKQLLQETYVAYKQPKVHNDEELAERLDRYFSMCVETGQVPTVEEMALYTGYSIDTVWDWENGRNKGFSDQTSVIIKKAKSYLKTFDAKLVTSGQLNFLTYCFRAKNYYGMTDKQEVVVTPNNPMGDIIDATVLQERIEGSTVDEE